MNSQISNPELSIITVCYNSGKTLRRTLESIDAQQFQSFEHILIDGDSTDDTLKIAGQFQTTLRSTIVSEPDSGIYDAMNKGLRLARGKFVHFLNADDYYCSSESLTSVIPYLDDRCLNYANLLYINSEDKKRRRDFLYQHWKLHIGCSIYQPVTLYPRAIIDQVGEFNTKYRIASDYDYLLRCLKLGRPKHIAFDFVEMSFGGVSSINVALSFQEFREISIKNGCPSWLATCICNLKTWNATRKLAKRK